MSAIAGASNDPRPNAPSGGVPATTTHALALPGDRRQALGEGADAVDLLGPTRDATSTAAAM